LNIEKRNFEPERFYFFIYCFANRLLIAFEARTILDTQASGNEGHERRTIFKDRFHFISGMFSVDSTKKAPFIRRIDLIFAYRGTIRQRGSDKSERYVFACTGHRFCPEALMISDVERIIYDYYFSLNIGDALINSL
jgi:hypothetical protein